MLQSMQNDAKYVLLILSADLLILKMFKITCLKLIYNGFFVRLFACNTIQAITALLVYLSSAVYRVDQSITGTVL